MVTHIRFTGSKLRVANLITARMGTNITNYFEGFVGTGVVYLTAAREGRFEPGSYPLLCDLNASMLSVLDWIQCPDDFMRAYATAILHLETEGAEGYYATRKRFRKNPQQVVGVPFEKLVDILVLRLGAFQGMWRVNKLGEFNVPYRHRVTISDGVDQAELIQDAKSLGAAPLICDDFEFAGQEWVNALAPGRSVAYFDPPYFASQHTAYTAEGFGDEDQLRLIRLCADMSQAGVHVLLSNSNDPVYQRMIEKWWPTARRHEIEVYRSMSCKAATRGPQIELLYESGT